MRSASRSNERKESEMNMRNIFGAIAIVVAIGVAPTIANAEPLTVHPEYTASLPYVTDVNPAERGYCATVECAGNCESFELVVTDEDGNSIASEQEGERVWIVQIEKGETYRIALRGEFKGCKTPWKAIAYGVE
jgi:hypothetical protein